MAARKKTRTPPAFDCLAVTDVKVFPLPDWRKTGPMKAIADVVLNDQLVLRGLRVMDGVNGLYIGYPVDPFCRDDDYKLMYHPVTRQLKEHIENCVLEMYHACTDGK